MDISLSKEDIHSKSHLEVRARRLAYVLLSRNATHLSRNSKHSEVKNLFVWYLATVCVAKYFFEWMKGVCRGIRIRFLRTIHSL